MSFSSLDELIAPLSSEEFFQEYFGKKPVHIQVDPDRLSEIMNWDELNGLVRQAEFWTQENFKLVKNGNPAPPHVYCRPTPPSDMRPAMRPAWDLVKPQLADGATIALYFVQSMTEPLRRTTSIIEEAFRGRCQMNIYCSWARGQGLTPHFDTHDVFALHIEGTKQWRVYDDPIDRPVAHDLFQGAARKKLDAKKRKIYMQPVMEPGSLLYIPRGWYHDALTETPGCFHIAAGVHYPVGLDILNIAWQRLSGDPVFRSIIKNCDENGSEEALKEQLEEMGDTIAKSIKDPALLKDVKQIRDNFRTEKIPAELPGDIFPGMKNDKRN